MSPDRCDHAAVVLRMDAAFRAGDLDELRAAAGDQWSIPNGPMPRELGSCLEYAIYWSPLPFIRELLELGANVRPSDHHGFPPLVAALWQSTRTDVEEVVALLLSFGADPDQRGFQDYTALHVATVEQRPGVVRMLLAHGADPTLRTRIDNLESPLDLALEVGNEEIVALLKGDARARD